jgi:hypothetical protein
MQPLTLRDLEIPLGNLEDARLSCEATLLDLGEVFEPNDRQRQQIELARDLIELAQKALALAGGGL